MHRVLLILTCCVVVCLCTTSAIAQTSSGGQTGGSLTAISSFERRAADVERRERTRVTRAAPAPQPETSVRIVPSLNDTDSGTRVGLGVNLVYAPPSGAGNFTFRPSYRTTRPRAADQPHVNGYGIGADLQLTSDANPFGQLIVSGDYVRTQDIFALGVATLEYDHGFGDHVTLIGTASWTKYTPDTGSSASDIVPGIELDFVTPSTPKVRIIGAYTFTNDVDGEDDYEAGVRFSLGTESAARVVVGKHGRVTANFVQTLKR